MPTTTTKESEIMEFLHQRVFDPILNSTTVIPSAKTGIRYTIMRMNRLKAKKMVGYFWNAIAGTHKSIQFAELLKNENLPRFEDIIEEFRVRFTNSWLTK